MIRTVFTRAIVLLLAAFMLSACGESVEWNQKLVIEVSTPGGSKAGSSVVHVKMTDKSFFLSPPEARGVATRIRGEAVVVEVANGKYLFALLGDAKQMALDAFRHDIGLNLKYPNRPGWPKYAQNITRLRGQRTLHQSLYPLLVAFDDINVPASVREVKPDDLATVFGPGYGLTSMTLEITDEPVTKGRVERLLGWLEEYYDQRLDGKRYGTIKTSNPFANSLASGNFDTERN